MQKTRSEMDRIRGEAAEWLVLEADGNCTSDSADALRSWLKADAENQRIYVEMKQLWQRIGDIPGLAPSPLEGANDNLHDDRSTWPLPRGWRRAMAMAGGAAAAAVAAIFIFASPAQKPLHLTTGLAQIKKVELEDGSVVTLAPMSEIEVVFADGERRTSLSKGEAFFEVAKDPKRPFLVRTRTSSIKVVGTQFNIRDGTDLTQVGVVEGVVEIRSGDGSKYSENLRTLRRGQAAEVQLAENGRAIVSPPGSLDGMAGLAGGWKDGWLAYNNARLSDIISDANRYYAPGIVFSDPKIRDMRYTVSFRSNEISKFIRTLGSSDSIQIDKYKNGKYVINLR